MNSLAEILNAWSLPWWRWMAHAGWQSALVAVIALGLVRIGRRWPSPLRHALLLLALMKFLMPPTLALPSGLFSFVEAHLRFSSGGAGPSVHLMEVPPQPPAPLANVEMPPGSTEASPRLHSSDAMDRAAASPRPAFTLTWRAAFMLLHAFGVSAVLGWLVFESWFLHRARDRAERIVSGALWRSLEEAGWRLGVTRLPELRISSDIGMPVAFGVVRPTILLPAAAVERLSGQDLAAIVAHELAHFRRGDLWLNWFQWLLAALWWFHPLIWMVRHRVRTVREECCDDLLLDRGLVSSEDYSQALINAARELTITPAGPAAIGFGEGPHPLGPRIARIMDLDLRPCSALPRWSAAMVLTLAAVLLPGARSQTPASPAAPALAASHSTVATNSAEEPLDAPEFFPWIESSATVRMPKTVLSQLQLPAYTFTNVETMRLVLTDQFIDAIGLTQAEASQLQKFLDDALRDYRIAERNHLEPISAALASAAAPPPDATTSSRSIFATNSPLRGAAASRRDPAVWVTISNAPSYLLHPFPDEAAAIRKRLDEQILSLLGEARSKIFSLQSNVWLTALLASDLRPVRMTISYSLRQKDSEMAIFLRNNVGEWTIDPSRDQYAPESILPILKQWRARIAGSGAAPSSMTGGTNHLSTASLEGARPWTATPWVEEASFVDMPKSILSEIRVAGLGVDEEITPEAIALFGLTVEERKSVLALYGEMRGRFRILEASRLRQPDPNKPYFVVPALPVETAALRDEWNRRLKALLGMERGELLDHAMRKVGANSPTGDPFVAAGLVASSKGAFWLTLPIGEIQIEILPPGPPTGLATWQIKFPNGGGGMASTGGDVDQVPEGWSHLVTPGSFEPHRSDPGFLSPENSLNAARVEFPIRS